MLSEIEYFILGGNFAHELRSISLSGDCLTIAVAPVSDLASSKKFSFENVKALNYQCLLEGDQKLEFSLPIIGFDSKRNGGEPWEFCLNAVDAEWIFTSDWPKRVK